MRSMWTWPEAKEVICSIVGSGAIGNREPLSMDAENPATSGSLTVETEKN